jgi:hypothetical protein
VLLHDFEIRRPDINAHGLVVPSDVHQARIFGADNLVDPDDLSGFAFGSNFLPRTRHSWPDRPEFTRVFLRDHFQIMLLQNLDVVIGLGSRPFQPLHGHTVRTKTVPETVLLPDNFGSTDRL